MTSLEHADVQKSIPYHAFLQDMHHFTTLPPKVKMRRQPHLTALYIMTMNTVTEINLNRIS